MRQWYVELLSCFAFTLDPSFLFSVGVFTVLSLWHDLFVFQAKEILGTILDVQPKDAAAASVVHSSFVPLPL